MSLRRAESRSRLLTFFLSGDEREELREKNSEHRRDYREKLNPLEADLGELTVLHRQLPYQIG